MRKEAVVTYFKVLQQLYLGRTTGIFLFATTSRPALVPIQLRIQWLRGTPIPRVKWPGREATHTPPSSTEVKKAGAKQSLPPTRQGTVRN